MTNLTISHLSKVNCAIENVKYKVVFRDMHLKYTTKAQTSKLMIAVFVQ